MLPQFSGDAYASEKVSVGTGAGGTGLTAATYRIADTKPRCAVITTDITTDFRYSVTTTAPTGTDGHFVDVSVDRNPIVLWGLTEIERFRAITASGTAVLYVTYFR